MRSDKAGIYRRDFERLWIGWHSAADIATSRQNKELLRIGNSIRELGRELQLDDNVKQFELLLEEVSSARTIPSQFVQLGAIGEYHPESRIQATKSKPEIKRIIEEMATILDLMNPHVPPLARHYITKLKKQLEDFLLGLR